MVWEPKDAQACGAPDILQISPRQCALLGASEKAPVHVQAAQCTALCDLQCRAKSPNLT